MTFENLLPNAQGHAPIYMKLANALRERIAMGEIRTGDALPSERDLCDILGASRVTVRKAIDTLIDEGLLFRKQGSGTFVAQRIEAPASYLSSFSEDAAVRGEVPGVIWVMKLLSLPSDEEARLLELSPETSIVRLGRVRLAGGEPLAIENAIVPAHYLPGVEAIGNSLYEALAQRGNRPVTGTQKIRASLATPAEADLLSIAEKTEILRIERLTRLANGKPVEFTRSAYRGDRYNFVSELRGGYALL